MAKELLSEQVIEKHGSLQKVRRYYSGWHPDIEDGVLVNGWTGRETMQEKESIKALQIIEVHEERR